MNNLETIIEKINIAELDPSKTYFIQLCCIDIPGTQLAYVHKILRKEFDRYGINNIVLFTPPNAEIKFTEIGDKND